MTEKLEAWWRAPPEHAERVEQNRQAFMAQFGDFKAVASSGMWLGCSPDGQYLGLQFDLPDGVHRIALPWQDVDAFFTELAGAMEYMGLRQLAHVEPGGKA